MKRSDELLLAARIGMNSGVQQFAYTEGNRVYVGIEKDDLNVERSKIFGGFYDDLLQELLAALLKQKKVTGERS